MQKFLLTMLISLFFLDAPSYAKCVAKPDSPEYWAVSKKRGRFLKKKWKECSKHKTLGDCGGDMLTMDFVEDRIRCTWKTK